MVRIKFETGQEVDFEGTPTQADIDEVASKLGVQKPKEEGFLSRTAKAIISPVATLAARPFQLGAELLGASAEQVNKVNLGGYIAPVPQSGKDVLRDVGRAAETVSLGIGGSGAVTAAKTGLKGLVIQGAKEGAITGLKAGALTGFGQGLQQASEEPPEQAFKTIFSNTALGGALGGVTGGVFGAATPLTVKAVSGLKKFTNLPALESKLSEGYKKILNPTARQIKVDSRFGRDSFSFLAQEAPDLPISVNKDGRIVADDAIEMLKRKYSAEATAYKPIIRNSGKYVDIDQVIANAKRQAGQEFDGSDLLKAEQQIDDEVNSFLRNTPQDVNVTPSGKRFVSLDRADDIKTYSWNRGKGWGTPEAEVWNDTNNLIGHSLKDAIEKELPNAPIKAMNKRLGQYKNAIDMLERRNGNVSGSGGKLSKYLIRSVGTSVGAGLGGDEGGLGGGISGAGAGFVTAEAIAMAIANPNVRLYVVRQLLKNLQKAGRQDLILEAEQILQRESMKYLLPSAGQSSYKAPINTINLPQSAREFNLGLDEVRGAKVGYSQPNALQTAKPIQPPTTAQNINSNISKNPSTINLINQSDFPQTQDAYFGTSKSLEGGSYGKYETKIALPKSAKIIDLNELTPETLNFIKDVDKIMGEKSNYKDVQQALDAFDATWAFKKEVVKIIKKYGLEGATFQGEYILPKEIVAKYKVTKK